MQCALIPFRSLQDLKIQRCLFVNGASFCQGVSLRIETA
jgi:hypothetical protein